MYLEFDLDRVKTNNIWINDRTFYAPGMFQTAEPLENLKQNELL